MGLMQTKGQRVAGSTVTPLSCDEAERESLS